ncbi:MAG: cation:proton antiporter [Coriobacteriales bacterium]|jgi:CPA1 family monovalent cation:H+ antiporter|nr:cation:proton antiporter [Coriobacteriales bacterium]
MTSFEYILVMLVAVLVSSLISQRFAKLSTPIIQIALGVAIALVPFFHFDMSLEPELFLVLFIAPLLFEDAKRAEKPTLWRLKRPILLLALGLVFVTCLAVGGFVHATLPAIPLAAAFALAAALAPTDAVAVGSLEETADIGEDKRALLQGEALFNDASSIVCFQFALAALAVGPFAATSGSGEVAFVGSIVTTFLFMFLGGVAVGATAMGLRALLVRFLKAAGVESITFHVLFEVITPFIVFLAAEAVGVSGIIAVVVAGIAYSIRRRRQTPSAARHHIVSTSVWSVASFTLNGIVFLILGTQLPHVIGRVWAGSGADFGVVAVMIALFLFAIMFIRFAWVFVVNRNAPLALEALEALKAQATSAAAQEGAAVDGVSAAREGVAVHADPADLLLAEEGATGRELVEARAESAVFTFEELAARRAEERRTQRSGSQDERRRQRHARLAEQRGRAAAERTSQGYLRAHARDALVLTLTGVKGAISLALLLTIPLTLQDGTTPFPERDLLLLLASGIIIASLVLANILVPLVSPRKARPIASDDEIAAILDIYRSVLHTLMQNTAPADKAAAEEVIRLYSSRLLQLKSTRAVSDPAEDDLRKQIIQWELDYTLRLVDIDRLNPLLGSAYVYQLGRVLARLEHHGETTWVARNIFLQIAHGLREARTYRRSHPEAFKAEKRLGKRKTAHILQELQRENYQHVVERLEAMLKQPDAPTRVVTLVLNDFKRRLMRFEVMDARRRHRRGQLLSDNGQQRAAYEEKVLAINEQALRYERDAINAALVEGRISPAAAQRLRDTVTLMELDIEGQLE